MSDASGTIPPSLMFRSFLTVGSGYAAHMIALFATALLVGQFFPEFAEFVTLEPSQQEQIMQTSPHSAIPRPMFWSIVSIVAVLSFIVGWFAYRSAPFKPFVHAAFISAILFVNYLQQSINQPPPQKALTVVYLVVFPIAVLTGGYVALRRSAQPISGTPTGVNQDLS